MAEVSGKSWQGRREGAVLQALDRQVIGEVWTSEAAYENLRALCDTFGHRFAGSPGERGAAGFLQERLKAYGLEPVAAESFRYVGWGRGHEHLEVVTPSYQRLPSLALPYCPAGEWEADLRWVGDGEADDYQRAGAERGALRGTFVMTAAETAPRPGRPASHRRAKYQRAVEAGAVGYLYVNQNLGNLPITGGLPGGGKAPASIPGLGLTFETGELLRRLLEQGPVRLRLAVTASFPEVETQNVYADLEPDLASPVREELVICGAHYDSHDISPGAMDNGAGTVLTLEAARVLAAVARQQGRGFARRLRFCFFGAEEIGLLGSWDYAHRHAGDMGHTRFMLNLDTTGRGAPGTEAIVVTGLPELVPYFEAQTRDGGYPVPVRSRFSAASDHFPFAMSGVPTAGIGAVEAAQVATGLVGRGWGHTPADTFDKVNAKSLQSATMLAARLLLHVAEAGDWPARQRTVAEVEQQLKESGLLEDLVQSGRWPPPR